MSIEVNNGEILAAGPPEINNEHRKQIRIQRIPVDRE